jgi:hypothetical protein
MPDNKNQKNKEVVWDFWQRMNYLDASQVTLLIKSTCHPDINWNGPHPLNHVEGVDALLTEFWYPLLRSFPDLKRKPYIFMGGNSGEEEWVSGVGYLTGTFVQDWLGIPATGEKTNIHFGQFYVMRDQKIAESYVIYDLLAVMRQAGKQGNWLMRWGRAWGVMCAAGMAGTCAAWNRRTTGTRLCTGMARAGLANALAWRNSKIFTSDPGCMVLEIAVTMILAMAA